MVPMKSKFYMLDDPKYHTIIITARCHVSKYTVLYFMQLVDKYILAGLHYLETDKSTHMTLLNSTG